MGASLGNSLSEQEDSDAQVNRLLRQFQSSSSRHVSTTPSRVVPKPQWDPKPVIPQAAHHPSFEISVPSVDDPDLYEYLPGHFAVRSIINIDSKNLQGSRYTVRLRSGEMQNVSDHCPSFSVTDLILYLIGR